jgi:hypothetical protein
MKTAALAISGIFFMTSAMPYAAEITFTNLIYQEYFPDGDGSPSITHNPVTLNTASGVTTSPMPTYTGYSRFDLRTMSSAGVEYPLDSAYVGTYKIPKPTVRIVSLDTSSEVPRTRADMPFEVVYSLADIDPASTMDVSKKVIAVHTGRSYGLGGNGIGLDRTTPPAEFGLWGLPKVLDANTPATADPLKNEEVTLTDVPKIYHSIKTIDPAFVDATKVRGEERFSIYSVFGAELAGATIQVWPVATGTIEGIEDGQTIKFRMPQLTLTLTDLYPKSTTYLQAYRGKYEEGKVGLVVPFPPLAITESVPLNQTLLVQNYDNVITGEDDWWTFELLHSTPFDKVEGGGVLSLDHKTVFVDRTLDVNGNFTTSE